MAKDSYSLAQENTVRSALLDVHLYGLSSSGVGLAWKEIAAQIIAYTDYVLNIPDQLHDEDQIIDLEVRLLKNMGEKLRQFVEGPRKNRSKKRSLKPDMLETVIRFLTHKDVGALDPLSMSEFEASIIPAIRLADYFWNSANDNQNSKIEFGELYRSIAHHRSKFLVGPTNHKRVFTSIVSIEVEEFNIKADGVLVVLPDCKLLILLRDMETGKNVIFQGTIEDDGRLLFIISFINQQDKPEMYRFIQKSDNIRKVINFEQTNIWRIMNCNDIHSAIDKNNIEKLREFIERGDDINASDGKVEGFTALHRAALFSSRAAIRELAKHPEVDYLAEDEFGRSPLDMAIASREDAVVVRYLAIKEKRQFLAARANQEPDQDAGPQPKM